MSSYYDVTAWNIRGMFITCPSVVLISAPEMTLKVQIRARDLFMYMASVRMPCLGLNTEFL